MHLRETREVLVFEEHIGRLLHLFNVQIAVKEEGIVDMERILRACDVILIRSRDSVEAGMHLRGDLPNPIDDDVLRKKRIHLMGKRLSISNLLVEVKMGIIIPRMDPRIGTATTCDRDGLPKL